MRGVSSGWGPSSKVRAAMGALVAADQMISWTPDRGSSTSPTPRRNVLRRTEPEAPPSRPPTSTTTLRERRRPLVATPRDAVGACVAARIALGIVGLVPLPAWAVAAPLIGDEFALTTPRGAWIALYFYTHIALLDLACAIPHRPTIHRAPVQRDGLGVRLNR